MSRHTRVRFESNRPRAVLFEGPPGTGKTLAAKILAARCGRPLVQLKAERVLLVGERSATIIGSPLIAGASVILTVEEQALGDKQIIFKKKRRKNYRRWKG